ncbi:MAG TPA: thioredoxin family protein [Flavitalea sp.]|nr:thioredoxin family protein [Flavitalea sp.]
MKLLLLSVIVFFSLFANAQSQYEVVKDGDSKILKGILTQELISKDTSFHWYAQNKAGYVPQTDAVAALKSKGEQLQILAFGGTWCGDTKNIFPKFFSILDAASFPATHVTVIGVDRNKKTIGHLAEALNVVNVPTFIILKDGKELGRVVEYGKTGQWDKELSDIINAAK